MGLTLPGWADGRHQVSGSDNGTETQAGRAEGWTLKAFLLKEADLYVSIQCGNGFYKVCFSGCSE